MTKSGTFELSDEEHELFMNLYDEIKKITSITLEEFSGKMIIEGINSFSKKIIR